MFILSEIRNQILLHEAKVVRSIFDALVREQESIAAIVRELNAQQIPTRRGAPRWDRATVWGMLQNPAYMGKAAFGKTEATERGKLLRPIRGKSTTPRRPKSTYRDKPESEWVYIDVPAIVDADVFEAVKSQLERNRKLSQRNGRGQRYLLQGLTVCANCGYAFYGKTVSKSAAKGGKRYAYYRCIGGDSYRFAGGRICQNPQVRVDQLDEHVWESVYNILKSPERLMEEWSRRGTDGGPSNEARQRRDNAARLLSAQERSLQRLVDAYEAGAIELTELKTRTTRVRARLDQARKELDEAARRLDETIELRSVITRLEDFSVRVRDGLDGLTWLERRQLIRTLVAKVEIDEDGATVVYRLKPSAASAPSPDSPSSGSTGAEAPASFPLRKRSDKPIAGQSLHALRIRCLDATACAPHRVRALFGRRRDPLLEQVRGHAASDRCTQPSGGMRPRAASDKTRIAYCKDANRKKNYRHTSFDFLGFTFRPRLSRTRGGEMFVNFSPAMSAKSANRVREEIRSWGLSRRWVGRSLEEVAAHVNPRARGWMNYYGRFFRSECRRIMQHLNRVLVRWAARKFKRFHRRKRKASRWLQNVARREPQLFAQWTAGVMPSTAGW